MRPTPAVSRKMSSALSSRRATNAIEFAARVIGHCSREHPADMVLREQLRAAQGWPRRETAEVAELVFAYYRWLGWLDKNQPLHQQISASQELARSFGLRPDAFSDADLVARAVPSWVSEEMTVTGPWTRALQRDPRLWLRTRRGHAKKVSSSLGHCRPFGSGELPEALTYAGQEDLFRTEAFAQGQFELQDITSQAVGFVCAPQPGETWWDACAGEGGKTLHLSDLMENKGLIWASDRAEWRLKKLKRRAARAGVHNYRVAAWDGGERLPTRTKFSGVLVDAPCSGIGTWQRNPHARWTTQPRDVHELAQAQANLLLHASKAVKPGGRLVYAVCTLALKETSGVVEEFQRQRAEFAPAPFGNPLAESSQASHTLFLWPQDFSGNGMFIAAWRRER